MSNLGGLIKQYNRFINDLRIMLDDIHELLENDFKMKWIYEFWKPRDRAAWSSKERYSRWYSKDKNIFYNCIDLIDEIPYLMISFSEITNKKYKFSDFGENNIFESIENEDIEKKKESKIIFSFKQDWGICYNCKIELESISSNQIINTEIKTIIECMLNKSFNEIKVKNIRFIEN